MAKRRTKDINEIVLNPVRMRLIQEMAVRGSITVGELCEAMPDVPRTTLYRHVAVLIDNGIATVVSERKIRGVVERNLSLNVGELGKHNTRENAAKNALAFLLDRYSRIHAYFGGDDADPGRDRIFLNGTVMMMSDEEFDRFLASLRELLIAYSLGPGEGRKARDISIISTPVDQSEARRP